MSTSWGDQEGGAKSGGRELAPRLTKAEKEERERREAARAAEKEALEGVGKRIALARKEAGVTQRQVSDHLGITETMVSNIERGIYSPYKYLTRLEGLLGKDREWFLHGTDGVQEQDLKLMLQQISERVDAIYEMLEPQKKRKAS
jgi:transcriptional regulator with XRE-family HTH domain